jgi:NAD(P)-dependent dehydrogenase (short-subunit alcohol dehydrogenase family)
MDLELAGQTAVVVGAAQGIGFAIAREFAAEGSDVVLVDRDQCVEAVAADLAHERGVRTLSIVADITDYAAMQNAARRVQEHFGRTDHVVHAAATGSGKYGFPFWNLAPADWPRVLEVNILGAVHVAHAFTPAMIAARQGTLLFLSSVAGQIGSQTDPPYSASKAALINFAQCAAKDLAPHNVRVNTLCPGMVKTTINRAVWQSWHDQQPVEQRIPYEEWADEKVRRVVPLGRWQQPEDIATMAIFLASPRAHNITGQTINVDGGFVMHW